MLRSLRTRYRICRQFVVEFGRVSVNTGALLGEASRDARLLEDSRTIPIIQRYAALYCNKSSMNGFALPFG